MKTVNKYFLILTLMMIPLMGFSQKDPLKTYNLSSKHVAVQGYDVVSYFVDKAPVEGKSSISSTVDGVVYYFSSEEHKNMFDADSSKYEPQYGGWCAWAMNLGKEVDIDPTSYDLRDGKLYLFYNSYFNDTKEKWLEDPAKYEVEANKNWESK